MSENKASRNIELGPRLRDLFGGGEDPIYVSLPGNGTEEEFFDSDGGTDPEQEKFWEHKINRYLEEKEKK